MDRYGVIIDISIEQHWSEADLLNRTNRKGGCVTCYVFCLVYCLVLFEAFFLRTSADKEK